MAAELPAQLTWIDRLRGIAALAIVVFHYHHFYLADASARPSLPPTESFPYAAILGPLYTSLAAHAVELFWVISGVVFVHVYLRRATTVRDFAVARFARLYPLHLATLLAVAALQAVSLAEAGHWQVYGNNDLRHFLLHLGMMSNSVTLSHGLSFNGPFWSVSLEVPVYAVFLAGLPLLRRAPIPVAAGLAIAAFWLDAARPIDIAPLQYGILLCAGHFYLGALLYAIHARTGGSPLAGAVAILGGASLAVALSSLDGRVGAGLAVAATCAALVTAMLQLERIVPLTGGRSWLGDISYAVYLVHVPVQIAVLLAADLAFAGDRSFAQSPLTLPLYLAATLGIAHVAFHGFERPAGRWLRRRLSRSVPPSRPEPKATQEKLQ